MDRWIVCKSDGDYGEYEVIDRTTGKPEVRLAWLTKRAAQRRAKELNS
jgi:hypothetical protein